MNTAFALNLSHIKLVVGLGNPLPQYEHTRHNIGQEFLFELTKAKKNESFPIRSHKKFLGQFIHGNLSFLFPETFMNLSGKSVLAVAQFYQIKAEEILVLHDEIDFPLGKIQLKQGGSHAGHNGLKSLEACLKSRNFFRCRLGIGRPLFQDQVSDYVLSCFSFEEKTFVQEMLIKAKEALVLANLNIV